MVRPLVRGALQQADAAGQRAPPQGNLFLPGTQLWKRGGCWIHPESRAGERPARYSSLRVHDFISLRKLLTASFENENAVKRNWTPTSLGKSRLAEKTRLVDKKIEILQNGDISFSVNR